MALPRPSVSQDWTAPITEEARKHQKGKISVYNAGPRGALVPTAIAARPARIQQLREPTTSQVGDQWTPKRYFHFQIDLLESDPLILKGMIVRVDDGHKDKTLEQYAYTVENAVNSSDAALRTIKAVSEIQPVPAVA